jgi:hypothetical protein
MKLQYTNMNGEKNIITAAISFNHSSCSYGQAALVTTEGVLDYLSWDILFYKVIRATKKEREELAAWLKQGSDMLGQ